MSMGKSFRIATDKNGAEITTLLQGNCQTGGQAVDGDGQKFDLLGEQSPKSGQNTRPSEAFKA
jgi:hypothetical protein